MKTIKSLMAVAMLAVGIGATVVPNTASAYSQAMQETGAGSFDAISMDWISGGTFPATALTLNSGATGWTETNTALNAFASFNSTTNLYFTNWLSSVPGSYAFYAFNGNNIVDSAIFSAPSSGGQAVYMGAASLAGVSRAEQLAVSTPVPEPETYAMMLAGLGLMGFIARRRKQNGAAA